MSSVVNEPTAKVRLDKWLWAARFFKTRTLAAEAIGGGKVHVNGQRVKPARSVDAGDTLEIRRGAQEFTVVVKQLSSQRGPATQAQQLYQETAESLAKREALSEQRRLAAATRPSMDRRPSKKQRRHIIRFQRGDE